MLPTKDIPIFDILKAALTSKGFVPAENIPWDTVSQELTAQTVAALPVDVMLENPGVPTSIKQQWKNTAYAHIVRWEQILYAQDQVVRLLTDHNIPLVILKGTAAAIYYPKPQYRSMGDIDFLVREKDYRKAFNLMRSCGYTLAEPEDSEDYHYALEKDGILFELHRRLAKLPPNAESDFLMNQVHSGLEHVEWRQMEGYQVPLLPWLPNGLVLLQHIRQHLREGLGLRQIIDWMMYVNQELDDARYPQFQQVLQRTGLEPLALHVTRMCQLYLGLWESGISWCRFVEPNICETLMEYIMEQGNFGRKVGEAGKGIKALNRHKSGRQMFAWMQRQGKRHWKAADKHPFLVHFSFLYEMGGYISWLLHRKKPIAALVSDIRESRKRRRMFRQLLS